MWKKMLLFLGAVAVAWSLAASDRWSGPMQEQGESETEPAANEPNELSLTAALFADITALRVSPDEFAAWLASFAEARDAQKEPVNVVRSDLDGDGAENEWAGVLYEDIRVPASDEILRRTAYGVVVAFAEGGYKLRSFEFPEESYGRAKLETVAELTGDGRNDLVWTSFQIGAHTTQASYTVSSWVDGALVAIEGVAEMANASIPTTSGGKLALTGGLIGSAGAGPWQREYTDTYVVEEGALAHVDRTYAASPTPYHRAIDALWAEALGQTARAKTLFAEAAELEGASYAGYTFEAEDGNIFEGETRPEHVAKFEAAAKAFARFRLELFARVEAGESRNDACGPAQEATGFDADRLQSLNSPFGYMNPRWTVDTLCADIDELEP